MKEKIKENLNNPMIKILMLIGVITFLLIIVGATYAYFGITANNNGSNTTITGRASESGSATLNTNISNLYLKLKASDMAESKQGSIYYANSEESGAPITEATLGNGIYTLATASLQQGTGKYNCTYNYELSATVGKAITDGSDENVKVIIKGNSVAGGNKTYTLKELLSGSQTLTGVFKNLSSESEQAITIESTVENTSSSQNGLVGNNYTITINPKSGSEGFSCEVATPTFADELIASGKLWQSGLEGDGYRYTGTGVTCSYDNGNHIEYTSLSCPTLYNYTSTRISDGTTTNYTYKTSCPNDNSTYTYNCTESNATPDASTSPNNFICFGTTSLEECKANEEKYMYRIIGVFPDEDGEQHLKLIKYKQLGVYHWHNTSSTDTSWEESDLYKGLNGISGGSYNNLFIGNTTYDYLQNETWLNKIVDWKWTATNTLTYSDSGPDYSDSLTPSEIYLHEMNRSTKTSTVGTWIYPVAKIGLMYVSDYTLSLGSNALSMTEGTYTNRATLKTGWMHQSNNDTSKTTYEWTLSRYGAYSSGFFVWYVYGDGRVDYLSAFGTYGVLPVFYLTSDATKSSGSGGYSDPYILE